MLFAGYVRISPNVPVMPDKYKSPSRSPSKSPSKSPSLSLLRHKKTERSASIDSYVMTSHEERLQQAALVSLDLYTAVLWWKPMKHVFRYDTDKTDSN